MKIDRNLNIPLYKQVYDRLKRDISNKTFKEGVLLPSERELSEQFEVDRITVRRALGMLVEDGLVEKIAGLGTRVKELPGINTSHMLNVKNIMFVLPRQASTYDRITEPFNANLFYIIEGECKSRGYSLVYTTLGEGDDLVEVLNGNGISGIIFVSKIDEAFLHKAKTLNIPAILVNNKDGILPSIVADNKKGAYDAVKHLTALGHKRICVIMGRADYITSRERLEGYKNALLDSNIDIHEQVIKEGDWTFNSGYNLMLDILKEADKIPTAIFAFNDIMAFGALRAVKEAGMSVPDDISIVGFDDIEQCKFVQPPLTTVRVNTELMGKAACQYLFTSIETGTQLGIGIVIPTELKVRESTVKISG